MKCQHYPKQKKTLISLNFAQRFYSSQGFFTICLNKDSIRVKTSHICDSVNVSFKLSMDTQTPRHTNAFIFYYSMKVSSSRLFYSLSFILFISFLFILISYVTTQPQSSITTLLPFPTTTTIYLLFQICSFSFSLKKRESLPDRTTEHCITSYNNTRHTL